MSAMSVNPTPTTDGETKLENKMDDKITIFGYGSLLSEWSCLRTCKSASNHRVAVLNGYIRIFNLVSVSQIKNGNARVEKKQIAAVAVQKADDPSCQCVGVLFEIDKVNLNDLIQREHRYNITEEIAYGGDDGTTSVACIVFTASNDEEYKCKCQKEGNGSGEMYHEIVGQYYGGSLWGRTDIFPVPKYLNFCCNAASKLTFRGDPDFAKMNFQDSLLADGKTTVREYMEQIAAGTFPNGVVD